MIISDAHINKFLKGYFVFVLLELFLLGSGQLIRYHSLTLRMVNFVLLTVFCLVFFRKVNIKGEYLVMFYIFLSSLVLSGLIGFFNGASLSAIFIDVKPLLFFIYLIPFSLLIRTSTDIDRIIKIIKIAALILAGLYFLYLTLYLIYPVIRFGLSLLEINGEIFFRANGPFFFYKGFFFIMISIFLINKRTIMDKIVLFILLLAILLTMTRGLYLALAAPFFFLGFINIVSSKRIKLSNLITLITFLILAGIFLPMILQWIGNKSTSDAIRIAAIHNVNEAITPLSLVMGHGFGVAAGVNRVHLEISYYEILHKQGIVGLLVWCIPLLYCFRKLVRDQTEKLDKRFFLAVLSVYIISLTNPFINSPLGLSVIVIAMISMDIIYTQHQAQLNIETETNR